MWTIWLVREHLTEKKLISFGHCPNYLTPLPPIRASCTTFFGRQKRRLIARITEPSNNDYDNDGSDNCDYNLGTFLVLKMTKTYTHNLILMSRYRGQLHGENGAKNFHPTPIRTNLCCDAQCSCHQFPLLQVERRESIDMPSFDSNSRDHLEEGQNDRRQEVTTNDSSKIETKADNTPVTPVDDVSDDLEISDSDSSSGIKSREISDTEEVPQEKAGKSEDNVKREDSTKDKKRAVDVEDNDDYLLYLEDILRTVHKAYYDLHDQSSSPKASLDLKMVIPYVRKKTLQGVTMVMSGVVPTQVTFSYHEYSKCFNPIV